mmetsp:Transcript_44218/g.130355  ORF Transcript_44218/g.130355 Transcript_44218/m.130355 type:complete len:213 (-) Transcript_44218:174-812(-)
MPEPKTPTFLMLAPLGWWAASPQKSSEAWRALDHARRAGCALRRRRSQTRALLGTFVRRARLLRLRARRVPLPTPTALLRKRDVRSARLATRVRLAPTSLNHAPPGDMAMFQDRRTASVVAHAFLVITASRAVRATPRGCAPRERSIPSPVASTTRPVSVVSWGEIRYGARQSAQLVPPATTAHMRALRRKTASSVIQSGEWPAAPMQPSRR